MLPLKIKISLFLIKVTLSYITHNIRIHGLTADKELYQGKHIGFHIKN